ncbi:hypothetical protein [Actinacidiphila yeochonensis]|uniref:hypothetical protein n=1 Tax=Actinacidiphila yeochonensis TaxID=89050 RepID=UPI000564DAA2|nr:hypothetical protein [Actinacidiphila yeochonensis]
MPSRSSVRAALTVTAAAAAAAIVPAAAAHAAAPPLQHTVDALPAPGITSALPTQSVTGALAAGIAPVRDLKLDPLNNTTVDPLTNGLGTQVADFKPISTTSLTGPITDGGSLGTLPLVGTVTGLLPH